MKLKVRGAECRTYQLFVASFESPTIPNPAVRVRPPAPDRFVYRRTKGGLWQVAETMALALAPGITGNGVALGAILPPPGQGPEYLDALAQSRVPLRRAGSAEIVAENILHLLRQDFLTGVVIPIDGGEFL